MLAPLENRSLIEREPALSLEERVTQLEAANLALRDALRESRQAQKRSATQAARKIVAQTNEISRLQSLLHASRERAAALESGQAIVELGRRLILLSEANAELAAAARRVCRLDKTLCTAHAECLRLSSARDQAIHFLAANADACLEYCD